MLQIYPPKSSHARELENVKLAKGVINLGVKFRIRSTAACQSVLGIGSLRLKARPLKNVTWLAAPSPYRVRQTLPVLLYLCASAIPAPIGHWATIDNGVRTAPDWPSPDQPQYWAVLKGNTWKQTETQQAVIRHLTVPINKTAV